MNLVVKYTMFPHRNFHKYTRTSPDRKNHNHIDHILTDMRWHSSILNARSFMGADCDTDYDPVFAKIGERMAISKHTAQTFDGERVNVRKPNELEVRKEYQINFQIGL